jgi:hypothetical protein
MSEFVVMAFPLAVQQTRGDLILGYQEERARVKLR